ncbi:COG1355, Predicted dioxygenase [hydrothermal vent metagenome]|uniref:COG1355, Predicted dioxygenase n=1 Tax=hydrothermal vent metagenome TaxID=652676 RepID=A0A1W1BK36_9ZZZZ
MIRKESVRGSFYPQTKEEIEVYFEHFNSILEEHSKLPNFDAKAFIVPHAGYIYSGFSANVAYRLLQQSEKKNFVVIGPSHKVAFDGSSLCLFDGYATPFGEIESDKIMAQKLIEKFSFSCYEQAHFEHSTEVQFPFIKHYKPDAKIIEIVYSKEDPSFLAQVIESVLEDEEWGVIISTDLSHYYPLYEAKKRDMVCIEAVEKLELSLLHNGCEACGKIGVEAMLLVAKKLALQSVILDYRTSADASGDTSGVVGYLSSAFV